MQYNFKFFRLFQLMVVFFFTIVLLELSSWTYVHFFLGLSNSALAQEYAKSDSQQILTSAWNLKFRAHPFFGYVCDEVFHETMCNNYGFVTNYDFPVGKKNDEIIFGILGGSVASQIGTRMEELNQELRIRFQSNPKWKSKKFKFVNLAIAGYRLPQQFFVATYFAKMLDVAIEIDGANEMSGNPYPRYPEDYPKLTPRFFDDPFEDFARKWEIRQWRRTDTALLNSIRKSEIGMRSSFAFVFWKAFDSIASQRVIALSDDLVGPYKDDRPSRFYPTLLTDEQLSQVKIANWEKYSRLNADLFKKKGIPYFQFVQPSQYVPNAKIFTESERKVAISDREPWRENYTERMIMLQRQAKLLKDQGLPVFDLTTLFAKTTEPIFVDDFCHMNETGNDHLIDAILQIVTESI